MAQPKPGSIVKSEDIFDIIQTLIEYLDTIDSTLAATFRDEYIDVDEDDDEALQDLQDGLFETLDALAPDGYEFGPNPDDENDYGYWPVEDEDSEDDDNNDAEDS